IPSSPWERNHKIGRRCGAPSVELALADLGEEVERLLRLFAEDAALDLDRRAAERLHLLVRDAQLAEARPVGVFDGGAEDDAVAVGPVDRGEAHRAGLGRGVDGAAPEVDRAEGLARLAERVDLGVRGDVGRLPDDVVDGADDLAATVLGRLDDDGTERALPVADALFRLLDGEAHVDRKST